MGNKLEYQNPRCFQEQNGGELRFFLAENFVHEDGEGIVKAVDNSFFQGNDAIVGDVDMLGADFGAAFGDVAHAGSKFIFDFLNTVLCVQGVHFKGCEADHKPRADEFVFAVVVAQHMADVLT